MLTNPKYAKKKKKKAAQFIKSLVLIDQFRSAIIEYHFTRFWQWTEIMRLIERGAFAAAKARNV